MDMFPTHLDGIPKNRLDLVNDLELPDVTVSPYVWQPEESLSSCSSLEDDQTVSSDSSLALSRAMTDSEIDYGRYKRLKNRRFSDPWIELKTALDAFPPRYLESLNSFQDNTSESTEASVERRRYSEELRLKMERFFEEECRVFSPDDPGLLALEEALRSGNFKESDLDSLP
ncbi:uncharacterized protein LOC110997180 isoform X1 [Pieris rapae]|uniref:uncharacterized protein LOC110997180 isoform X1 n=1 Tax=Pieris rapae TaxID=64459 RepID=UPI001E27B196|nr:uncharacterized protein LOC110997180 isoform X1 [Pieris rapae]